MLFLLFHLTIIILVESRGEKYDLETFNIMQILRPVGSKFINATLNNNLVSLIILLYNYLNNNLIYIIHYVDYI